jgi:hypothetical protein
MSKDLREQLEDVTQDSSPADQTNDASNEDKKEDRSLDNVRGELIRKQEKLRDELSDLRSEIRGLTASLQSKPVKEQQESGNDLDKMPVQQLESLRGQVPEENLADFDRYLIERKVRETVDSKLGDFTKTQSMRLERDKYNAAAKQRYQELNDLSSDFARAVQRKLNELPDELVETNPRVVLDMANEVAVDQGVKPRARREVRGKPASADTAPAPTDKPQIAMSDEEMADIATKLSGALPRGKKFDMDRVKQRAEFYNGEETDLRINK